MSYAPLPTLNESPDALHALLRAERDAERRRRLHALVLIADGIATTRAHIAEHLAIHRNTVSRWLARYREGGIEAMLHVGTSGGRPGQRTVPTAVFAALTAQLRRREGFASYEAVQRWLDTHYGIALGYKSVHALVHRYAGGRLKVPRPVHPKKASPRQHASPRSSVAA